MGSTDKRTDAEFAAEMRRRKLEELLIIDYRATSFDQAGRIVAKMTDAEVFSELLRLTPNDGQGGFATPDFKAENQADRFNRTAGQIENLRP